MTKKPRTSTQEEDANVLWLSSKCHPKEIGCHAPLPAFLNTGESVDATDLTLAIGGTEILGPIRPGARPGEFEPAFDHGLGSAAFQDKLIQSCAGNPNYEQEELFLINSRVFNGVPSF